MLPSFLARNLFIPIVDGLHTRRKVLKELKEAEELQWLSREKIIERQWKRIQELIGGAYKWVPYYKTKFDKYGIHPRQIQAPEDLKKIPILTKEDINKHREKMVDPRYRARIYKNMTGGSTGIPISFYQVEEHWIKNTAATIKNYKWCGLSEGDRMTWIWGHPLEASQTTSIGQKMKYFITNKQVIPVLSLDESIITDAIRKIRQFQPKLILGYNTYLTCLAEQVMGMGINDIRPVAITSTANTLLESQRKTIEKAFNCEVFDRYGSRELGCIACECQFHDGYHVNMENVFVEFEDLAGINGEEISRLICTSIGNYGMPFIRYEIGDLGVSSFEPCPCGRGLPLIKKLKGRTHDILRTPSGKIITGDLFDLIFEHYVHIVRQFQVRQKRVDQMEVFLVLRDNVTEKQLEPIRSLIKKLIGQDAEVIFKIIDRIDLTRSGKLHLTISELGNS